MNDYDKPRAPRSAAEQPVMFIEEIREAWDRIDESLPKTGPQGGRQLMMLVCLMHEQHRRTIAWFEGKIRKASSDLVQIADEARALAESHKNPYEGSRQAVKPADFDSAIVGSNPTCPAKKRKKSK